MRWNLGPILRRTSAASAFCVLLTSGCSGEIINPVGTGQDGGTTTSSSSTSGMGGTGGMVASSSSGMGGSGGMLAGSGGSVGQGGATGQGGSQPNAPVPDFEILDVNPNSGTYNQPVSPRDYLMRVSAWYFGHAT